MKKLRTVFSLCLLLFVSQLGWSAQLNSLFEFALVTDIHIGQNVTSVEDLHNTVSLINNTPEVQFVFVAGDVTLGASLVVRAMDSGRKAAKVIGEFLKG